MDDSGQRRLVVATTNQGKLAEFRRLLPSEIVLLSLSDLALSQDPEVGLTFEEIARAKATHAASASNLMAIADDSGIEVDALYGAPGVRSARFAGDGATEQENRDALLNALRPVPDNRRSARFRCVVALATPVNIIATADGCCEGTISRQEAGEYGFGFDSIFRLPDGRTMAQVSPDEKNQISHRAHAYRAILPSLLAAFGLSMPEKGR